MVELAEVAAEARRAAERLFGAGEILSVVAEPTPDTSEDEFIQVHLTVKKFDPDIYSYENRGLFYHELLQYLRDRREKRLPLLRWATEAESRAVDD